MSKYKTGGSAFPSGESYRDSAGNLCGKSPLNQGVTLRDYFAAKAMQAYLTDMDLIWNEATIISGVEKSYLVADAMLAERERGV